MNAQNSKPLAVPLLMLLVVALLLLGGAAVNAESSLPWCPGDYSKNTWTNCVGTLTFSDGGIYVGEFRNDTMNGRGMLIDADGNKYVGEVRGGRGDGQGTYTWVRRKDKYVGEVQGWINGTGQGAETFSRWGQIRSGRHLQGR